MFRTSRSCGVDCELPMLPAVPRLLARRDPAGAVPGPWPRGSAGWLPTSYAVLDMSTFARNRVACACDANRGATLGGARH